MKITLYTTVSSSWYQKKADEVARNISKVTPCEIQLRRIRAPKDPVFIVDGDGDRRFAWDWFNTQFTGEAVGFHFTPYYQKLWNLKINGSRDPDKKENPVFWFRADKSTAKGYDISEFERLLYHEIGHFFEELDDAFGNKLTQDSVHITDYDLKQIHLYHHLVDFRGFNFKKKVAKVIGQVINLVTKAL